LKNSTLNYLIEKSFNDTFLKDCQKNEKENDLEKITPDLFGQVKFDFHLIFVFIQYFK